MLNAIFIIHSSCTRTRFLSFSLYLCVRIEGESVWIALVASRPLEKRHTQREREESTREQRTIGMPKKGVKRKLCWAIADFAITNFCFFFLSLERARTPFHIHTCTRKLLIPNCSKSNFLTLFVGCAWLMTSNAGKMSVYGLVVCARIWFFCIVFDDVK